MTLRAEHVCNAYGTAPVLADCSLTLRPGELVFLLGVNGAGKSTLLKLLAGVLDVQQGAVYCGDEALHRMPPRQRARCAAYLPQFTPAVDMTVEEYVLLGAVPYLSFGAVPGRGWRARVAAVLSEMELSALAGCGMGEISGGERQRAALAQVLLTQAPFLLLDEPTAHLDVRRQHEFLQRLRGLSAQQGKGILVSVHDPNLALRYAERVAVLSEGGLQEVACAPMMGPELEARLRRSYGAALRYTRGELFDWIEERG